MIPWHSLAFCQQFAIISNISKQKVQKIQTFQKLENFKNFTNLKKTQKVSKIRKISKLALLLKSLALGSPHQCLITVPLSCGWLGKKVQAKLTKYQFFCIAQGLKLA